MVATHVRGEFPDPPPYPDTAEPVGLATVGPDQAIHYPVTPSDTFPFDAVNKGERDFYLYGYLVYWDDFTIERGLTWCARYDLKTHAFNFCPTYNVPW